MHRIHNHVLSIDYLYFPHRRVCSCFLFCRKNVTVYGYTYTYKSGIESRPDNIYYTTHIELAQTTPIGYIGIQARLYDSGGSLVSATDPYYTEEVGKNSCEYINSYDTTSGYYYSKGQVSFYNGNGYSTYDCNSTPYFSPKSVIQPQINENGEIYGSEFFLNELGIQPDLISAVGDDGVLGYVKFSDLNIAQADSLEDAIAYSNTVKTNRTISLYSSVGLTVIGTFTIQNNSISVSFQ